MSTMICFTFSFPCLILVGSTLARSAVSMASSSTSSCTHCSSFEHAVRDASAYKPGRCSLPHLGFPFLPLHPSTPAPPCCTWHASRTASVRSSNKHQGSNPENTVQLSLVNFLLVHLLLLSDCRHILVGPRREDRTHTIARCEVQRCIQRPRNVSAAQPVREHKLITLKTFLIVTRAPESIKV